MRLDIHPFNGIDDARTWGRGLIDAAAGAARTRYLTVATGQDAVYQAKYADALAFMRAGYPASIAEQFPWVYQEAAATGVHIKEMADTILAAGAPWNAVLGPRIEALRMGGKAALGDMDTVARVVSHARAVCQKLEQT